MKEKIQHLFQAAHMGVRCYRAMEQGERVQLTRSVPIHALPPSFFDTVEGCILWEMGKEIGGPAWRVFLNLSPQQRESFASLPRAGERAARLRRWGCLLRPVLAPEDYHRAMLALCCHYRRYLAAPGNGGPEASQ